MDTGPSIPATSSANGQSPLAAERERVVQALSAHFAQDRLTLTEFEERLERAYNVSAVDQLQSLVADLPAPSPHAAPQGTTATAPALVPSSEVPPRGAVFAVMGGVGIIAPPGVRVESMGAAFMGGFELKAGDATALSPAHPVIRLSGLAIMGGVETETRLPGESAKEAKRRRRRAAESR
jgi:hypothetical protein